MGGALMVVSRTRREAGRGVGAGDPVTPLPLRPGSLGWGGLGEAGEGALSSRSIWSRMWPDLWKDDANAPT